MARRKRKRVGRARSRASVSFSRKHPRNRLGQFKRK